MTMDLGVGMCGLMTSNNSVREPDHRGLDCFVVVGLISACKEVLETVPTSEPKAMDDDVSSAFCTLG